MRIMGLCLTAVAIMLSAGTAGATLLDFDFAGNFTYDNDLLLFTFTVDELSNVTVFSSSWVNGGFDPMLGIWDAAGVQMAFQDDGGVVGSTVSNGVSYNTGVWDSYYTVSLNTGVYTASVTQYSNFPVDGINPGVALLSDGFQYDGASHQHFTRDLGYGPEPYFNGVWSDHDARQSFWAFHLLNVADVEAPPPIPEPATISLLGMGLLGFLARRYRRA